MYLLQKLKLPTLERNSVCYSRNLKNNHAADKRKIRRSDMHMPVIEINLHNITTYQKQRLFSFSCKCLQKLMMWLI